MRISSEGGLKMNADPYYDIEVKFSGGTQRTFCKRTKDGLWDVFDARMVHTGTFDLTTVEGRKQADLTEQAATFLNTPWY
jgi:hypothetical protein